MKHSLTKKIVIVAFFAAIVGGYIHAGQMPVTVEATVPAKEQPCRLVAVGKYDCTDQALLERLNAQRPLKAITEAEPKPEYIVKSTFTAYNTAYSRLDSCHNPSGKKCLTAIGRDTLEGTTVACPRDIKLGTLVRLNGHVYTCEDRYALRLDKKRGIPTVDIFFENPKIAQTWKSKSVTVEIVEKAV